MRFPAIEPKGVIHNRSSSENAVIYTPHLAHPTTCAVRLSANEGETVK